MLTIPVLGTYCKLSVLETLKNEEIVLLNNISEDAFKNLCREIGILNNRYGEFYNVVDTGQNYRTSNIPISQTREDTGVHTDSSAISYHPKYLSLFCVSPSESGGESYFVDMREVFFDISEHDPLLLEYLRQDFYRDVVTPGKENNLENIRANKFPIIKWSEDHLVEFRYMRYWIERGYQKLGQSHELEMSFLDRLDFYLENDKYRYQVRLAENQAIIFNNSYFPHGRTQYIEGLEQKRKFIRVWFDEINF
jgi:alpha-ketoglutarate-dependent taurine dioxygenase